MKELVLGGTRSGKSLYAEELAKKSRLEVIYIATAFGEDDAMRKRIRRHKKRRPQEWELIEEPYFIGRVITERANRNTCLIVDCLTLWASNLIHKKDRFCMRTERGALIKAIDRTPGHVILVSNETNLGLVPMDSMAHEYCDFVGLLHQQLGEMCDRVTFVVAGIPMPVKR